MQTVQDPSATTIQASTDFEVRSLDSVCYNESELKHPWTHNVKYFIAGLVFGIILIKSQVMSWYRIQEMFRLQGFHMYGVLGSAVATGMLSVWLLKKVKARTVYGEPVVFIKKKFSKGTIYGGLLFGFGWALTGACPGPLYAQVGLGYTVVLITLLSAIAGTWVYGRVREKLPH